MIHFKRKLLKLCDVLQIPGVNPVSFFKKGYSISSFQLALSVSTWCRTVSTVIDIGANIGQFAVAAATLFPKAKIYSFEPLPKVFKNLEDNTRAWKQIQTFCHAMGSKEGTIEFHENKYTHASSVMVISQNQKKLFPETSETKTSFVQVKKLDDVATSLSLIEPVLLKLDVQGFEKEVIEGAKTTLTKVEFLLFEASFIQMYEGEILFPEMHRYVHQLGYDLVAPVGFLRSDDSRIIQMDVLYRRRIGIG